MEQNLWAIRIKSFGWELLGVLITSAGGFLLSEHVAQLLTEYTGTAVTATLLGLVVSGVLKHLRNRGVLKAAAQESNMRAELGSTSGSRPFQLI